MKIGIDISQLAYEKTGVANYLKNLVQEMIKQDSKNEYILFFSSLRGKLPDLSLAEHSHVTIKKFKLPPTILDLLWNKMHIAPVEWFVGDVDIFISSDWTEPPAKKAKKATILYDLIIFKHPNETAAVIREVQKRKLSWVKKESDIVFAISEATKRDAIETLKIQESKISVIYPGLTI
ncbi:MAG TPA: glycosyltransferase [Candidatus Woesebacteria bacterium]|nr:glycosyltransferase [Candidatus Woesebacteria bacterium]